MIIKSAYEEFFRYHDFDPWLNDSETVTTAEVKCYEKDTGVETSSAMVSDAAAYSNTKVKYKLKAGEVGKTYILKIKIVSSNGQKFEDWLELGVK